jgi:hypothetical protein
MRFFITIVIAAILGGAIAFLGNQLGRYIGRKKLSIFRLRPRHTSILITTLTGTLIAAGTLLFAYLSSWEVRTLFSGLKQFQNDVITKTLQTVEQANAGIVFKDKEPILTAIIDGTMGKEAIEEQLKDMLGYANEATIEKSKTIARSIDLDFKPPPDSRLVGYIPENLKNLAEYIERGKKKYIVMVFALDYAFLGEKFAVGFIPVEYHQKVFSADEEIIGRPINGADAKGVILTDLAKLIVQAKGVALKKGMIENPKTNELIELDRGYLMQIIDQISKSKRLNTIVVRAKKDVDNRGPLEIYFEIKSSG